MVSCLKDLYFTVTEMSGNRIWMRFSGLKICEIIFMHRLMCVKVVHESRNNRWGFLLIRLAISLIILGSYVQNLPPKLKVFTVIWSLMSLYGRHFFHLVIKKYQGDVYKYIIHIAFVLCSPIRMKRCSFKMKPASPTFILPILHL